MTVPQFFINGLPDVPIGEICILVITDGQQPKDHKYHNVLLSREQLERVGIGPMGCIDYRERSSLSATPPRKHKRAALRGKR